ncbi:MAG TPA: hypothetical protein VNA22_04730, partial [Pyrinomonadaceae bacterium]|nr:hypothetical protein [Pyrinomonadaceae bacterium]
MAEPEDLAKSIRLQIDSHFEWLLVRASGRTFPLRRTEVDVRSVSEKVLFASFDDSGFGVSRVVSMTCENGEIVIDLRHPFGAGTETIRLIPR